MDVFYIEANLHLTEDVEYALDAADRMARESDVIYSRKESPCAGLFLLYRVEPRYERI